MYLEIGATILNKVVREGLTQVVFGKDGGDKGASHQLSGVSAKPEAGTYQALLGNGKEASVASAT